jgi:hypothetical protein
LNVILNLFLSIKYYILILFLERKVFRELEKMIKPKVIVIEDDLEENLC